MLISIDARGATWYAGTGIGTYTRQVLKHILEIDRQNDYYLFWSGRDYEALSARDNVKISISSRKHHRFWEQYYIPDILKTKNVDVYHLPQNGIGLPQNKSSLYVATVHDLIPYIMPETVGKGYLAKFISQMPAIISNLDMIITVSEWSKKDIMRIFGIPEEKIVVTHLAADDIFMPLDKSSSLNYVKENYGIDDNIILYLGGFSPRKNVKSILLAFSMIHSKLSKDYRIVIIGSAKDDHQFLIKLSQNLGIGDKVFFTGYVPYDDLPYFYNSAELFVYPSLYEGFGLPILEAMKCGTPTITSNVSSIPEIAGDGALLINPFDTEKLADAMSKVLEDNEIKSGLIAKGLERASLFSWRKTAHETLKVYGNVYNNNK
ncbi:mannosylfructose-phosphate synthase [Oxobacter pfennigii]|uniref:Mannosylfructose-phosphate synthase n=1 Tax=Oxobacter pfennigii TaxID=36849 RepID=A0A0P8WA05_9CLOT|nr:glycosyltransferase family 1 protein [Oxobacter pfennigii]KPU44553.1 mannosylfructose-phosphate synthase [Oxobacter pfennigii]